MKYWTMLLHFYQPPTQEDDVTRNILTFCYLPLLKMLDQKSGIGLTINITGCLQEQLKKLNATEFFDLISKLVADGKIELVNSAKYHPILPLIPKEVLLRQTENITGAAGFFPPELAVNGEMLDLINSKYVFVDETAFDTKTPIARYKDKWLLINNRQISDLLRSYQGQLQTKNILSLLTDDLVVTANDAELFGHHYSERLQALSDLLDQNDIKFVTASQAIVKFGGNVAEVSQIKPSTWQDCELFALWNKNKLQDKYLELLKINPDVDPAYSSCYLYWLSNWPWWHPGLVEKGVKLMPQSNKTTSFLQDMWSYHSSGQVEKNYKKFNEAKSKFLEL